MKRIFSYVMLVLLTLSMLSLLTPVRAEVQGEQEPYISVDPLESTVMVGDTFTINITVTNITDLFIWQFRLYFNSTILRYDEAWYPTGHVFHNKTMMPVDAVEGSDENGTYIDYRCALIFPEDTFTGDGTLCQINFTGMAEGSSNLSFGMPIWCTFLLDSDLVDISFEMTNGSVHAFMPLLGDLNHDRNVNILDLAVAGAAFGSFPGYPTWNPFADVNQDDKVNIFDLAIIAADFGKTA